MCAPFDGIREAVVGEFLEAQHVHGVDPEGAPAEAGHHLAVGGLVERRPVAVVRMHRRGEPLRALVGQGQRPWRGADNRRLQFAHVYEGALAGPVTTHDRANRPDKGRHPREVVRLVRRQLERGLALIAADVGPAAHRRVSEVVPRRLRQRALEAERCDRDMDRIWAPRVQGVAQRGRPDGRRRDNDVGLGNVTPEARCVARGDLRSLVGVDVGVHQRPIGPGRVAEEGWLAAQRVALGRLEQHDIRAVVAEDARAVGACEAVGDVEDAQVGEGGWRHCSIPTRLAGRVDARAGAAPTAAPPAGLA